MQPTYVNDVLQLILDDVCAGLTCSVYGAPQDCFISHTAPPDDCCDFVAIWMNAMLPVSRDGFPLVNVNGIERCGDTSRMMDVSLRVRRACYPVVRDNAKSPFPPPAKIRTEQNQNACFTNSSCFNRNWLWHSCNFYFAAKNS